MSRYLGNEIVIVGVSQSDNPGFAIVADVEKSGLDDLLRTQFSASTSTHGLVVLDERSLAAAVDTAQSGGYALIRPREVVFSNSLTTLKRLDRKSTRLNSSHLG